MQLTSTFFLLASLLAGVQAKCYGSGPHDDSGETLKKVGGVTTACQLLAGNYDDNESRWACIQDTVGTKWQFELHHVKGGFRSISIAECMDGMKKQAYNCKNGGTTKYLNWAYTADPNKGYCNME